MRPQLIERPEMTLVGLVGCGASVAELDISGLWERFDRHSGTVRHQIGEKSYEIHIQEETEPPMHFCLVGVEVGKVDDVPIELFVKTLPSCEYAVFTHRFSQGGFDDAFASAYGWLENSAYSAAHPYDIQCYDERFQGPDNPESILEIHIPVVPRRE